MATNVSEKDKTLHEVIDFLEKEWDAANNAVAATNVYILEREANDD